MKEMKQIYLTLIGYSTLKNILLLFQTDDTKKAEGESQGMNYDNP